VRSDHPQITLVLAAASAGSDLSTRNAEQRPIGPSARWPLLIEPGRVRIAAMPMPDANSNYAYVAVKSQTLAPEEVTALLRLKPDEQWHSGDVSARTGHTYSFHNWRIYLAVPEGVHAGTDGLSAALEGLGSDAAKRFGEVARAGGEVVCQFVQNVHGDDDHWATGIHLTNAALDWLSAAGAQFDVDQYFFPEPWARLEEES